MKRLITSCANVAKRWRLRRALAQLNMVSWVWLGLVASGWAQEAVEEEGKTYVPSYMIIIFSVGLALLMICRAGKRSISFRRDE